MKLHTDAAAGSSGRHLPSRGCFSPRRRKNVLRIPRGWLYYLAPEIVRQMSPEVDEDQLPFSRAADVYAFGYLLAVVLCVHSHLWAPGGSISPVTFWLLFSSLM